MQFEDFKNYVENKNQDLESFIEENPDDEENEYRQEKINDLKEILDELDGHVTCFIHLNYFSQYLEDSVQELYNIPDSILQFINYDKMEENMINNYEYVYVDILDQAYYYKNY
jgi:hypothetical protein